MVPTGLDAVGKTSLLYRLKLDEVVTTIPTIGFNVETINVSRITITCWDLGGRDKMRPLYRHYYPNTQGVVFVIDGTDRDRLDDALDELVKFVFLVEELSSTVVMVLVNKQDIPGAMTALDIQEALKQKYKFSSTSASAHTVFVRTCSVYTTEGVAEAFEEFSEHLRLRHAGEATLGLIPLDSKPDDANVKDRSMSDIRVSEKRIQTDTEDSLVARVGIKALCQDPFSFFKSMFY